MDAFWLLAEARAAGEMVLIPRMVTGNDRRIHVRETVREDHEARIATTTWGRTSDYQVDGERITHAQRAHLVNGDVFFGSVDLGGQSFTVRERAPYRGDLHLGDLSNGGWEEYADICGHVLAHTHAMSDEAGNVDYDVEPAIMDAIGARELFVDDMLRFADEAVARVRRDHELFVADHALGALSSVDVVYR